MFDAVDGVVISAREKVFPPKFKPTPTGKQPVAVVRPDSRYG